MAVAVLVGFHQIDRFIARRQRESPDRIEITVDDTKQLRSVLKFAQRIDDTVEQLDFKRTDEKGGVLVISVTKGKAHMLSEMLSSHKGVAKAEPLSALFWEHPEKG